MQGIARERLVKIAITITILVALIVEMELGNAPGPLCCYTAIVFVLGVAWAKTGFHRELLTTVSAMNDVILKLVSEFKQIKGEEPEEVSNDGYSNSSCSTA